MSHAYPLEITDLKKAATPLDKYIITPQTPNVPPQLLTRYNINSYFSLHRLFPILGKGIEMSADLSL